MNFNDDNLHEPRPRPIRPGITQDTPGANVRLLAMTPRLPELPTERAGRLWAQCQEDIARLRWAMRRGQARKEFLALRRRTIGEVGR